MRGPLLRRSQRLRAAEAIAIELPLIAVRDLAQDLLETTDIATRPERILTM